jgi:predicted site-specific integrase-resolvase
MPKIRERQPEPLSPLRLYRPSRLAKLLDVNPSTLWRWRKNGVLPAPVCIGGVHGWTHDQIAKLLSNREEHKDA